MGWWFLGGAHRGDGLIGVALDLETVVSSVLNCRQGWIIWLEMNWSAMICVLIE